VVGSALDFAIIAVRSPRLTGDSAVLEGGKSVLEDVLVGVAEQVRERVQAARLADTLLVLRCAAPRERDGRATHEKDMQGQENVS